MIERQDGHRSARTGRLIAIGIGIALAALAPVVWFFAHTQRADAKPLASATAPAASVVASTAQYRDVSVELKGIGVVQAYNTVTVKPRIGGQIMQVVFTEGQRVHQGDVLARIDSRFLLAQLHQAQATRAKDEAQLANAKRDLARLNDVSVKGFVSRQLVDNRPKSRCWKHPCRRIRRHSRTLRFNSTMQRSRHPSMESPEFAWLTSAT
jgi:multidrug efflux system membrane fusion protein